MTKIQKAAAIERTVKLRIKVGENFKKWRLGEDLRQEQVSDAIKVSQGSLSDIEKGHSLPAHQTTLNLKKKYPATQWDPILFP